MSKKHSRPSDAWLNEVFNTPPRRDVKGKGKSTTRVPTGFHSGKVYGEGGHEATALRMLNHFQRNGLARRVKSQPFFFEEIGGPKGRIPDILAELEMDPPWHIIQCKSKRFLTPEVQQKFDEEKAFLEPRGFRFHCWTDRDRLSRPTSQSLASLERGLILPLTHLRLSEIELAASKATVFGELSDQFGWDDATAAAANGAFYFDITNRLYEQTPLLPYFPRQQYQHLFEPRSISGGFWDSLAA